MNMPILKIEKAEKAFVILKTLFIILPIASGLDKFFNFMVDWRIYLEPQFADLVSLSPETFMMVVGVIEIIAGLIVIFRPRLGGYLVMIWMWLIIINLLTLREYYDIAARDFAISIAALALAKLSEAFGKK